MSPEVIVITPPRAIAEPRGAAAAAHIAGGLRQLGQALARAGRAAWRALEAEGQRRAERELRRHGLPQAAWEAAQVRALADLHERHDPRFAAELRVAADRHEARHGAD